MVSETLLKDLQQIVISEYKIELDSLKVSEIGNSLVRLFELLEEIERKDDKRILD